MAGATGRAADAGHVHKLSSTCLAVAPVIGNTTPNAATFTTLTIAANSSLVGATGTGGLSCGSMTGATALPTGNLSWAGASTKTVSLVANGGAITLTADAASTWKTTSGALTVDSAAALNLGTSASTSQVAGKSGTVWTFQSKVAYGATTGEYKANGSLSVHLAYRKTFLEIIAGQAGQVPAAEGLGKQGRSFMDISFALKCQYQFRALPGAPEFPIITDQVLGCRITGGGVTISAGSGVLIEKFPLYVGLIIRDGFIPVAGLLL